MEIKTVIDRLDEQIKLIESELDDLASRSAQGSRYAIYLAGQVAGLRDFRDILQDILLNQ
jgi:hypothetical protein